MSREYEDLKYRLKRLEHELGEHRALPDAHEPLDTNNATFRVHYRQYTCEADCCDTPVPVGVRYCPEHRQHLGRPPTEPQKRQRVCAVCLMLKGVDRIKMTGIKPASFEEPGATAVIRPQFCPACGEKL